MSELPVAFKWDGNAMVPFGRFAKTATSRFVSGHVYSFVEEELGTSDHSRRHYFACLRSAWLNLPEAISAQFPTSEILRKHALIRTGYCNSHQIVCASKGEAIRLAAALSAIKDAYAIVTIDCCIVTRLTARSQARRAMKVKEFQASKNAVFEFLAGILGVAPETFSVEEGEKN
ncbi:MAG: hypothetical protein L0Y60_04345 [Beijerinckiaceae bacterium]|nr:hypothetical protein [Beijerinckiaceae bacterium]